MGVSIKEFFRLVEDFVNMMGTQMSGFQDIYEVTENFGEPSFPLVAALCPCLVGMICPVRSQGVHQS